MVGRGPGPEWVADRLRRPGMRYSFLDVEVYLWLQDIASDVLPRDTGGVLGPAYAPLQVGTDRDNPSASNVRMTAFDPPKGLRGSSVPISRRIPRAVAPAEGHYLLNSTRHPLVKHVSRHNLSLAGHSRSCRLRP